MTVRRAQAEGGTERVRELRTLVDRGQLDERHLPRALVEEVGDHLEGQAGLAHAARAHQGDQSLAGDQLRQLGQLALTADEGRGWSGSTRRSARCGTRRQHPGRDLGLERGHGRGGVEPGLVGQPASQVVHDPQRLSRASLESEDASQHQLGALTERVGGGGASGVVDQRGVGPGGQSHLEEAVLQVAAQLLQPDTRGGQRGHVGELVEGRAPPLPQRITEQAHGLAGRDLLAPGRELAHLDHVELAGEQDEAVAVALPDQPVGGPAEVAPHPRHVAVQRAPPRVGDLGGPHRAEQLVDGDTPTFRQGQQGEHGPPPGAGDLAGLPVDVEAQRTEQVDPDRHGQLRCHRRGAPVQQATFTIGWTSATSSIDPGGPP